MRALRAMTLALLAVLLTITGAGAARPAVAVAGPPGLLKLKINFQPASTPAPSGYLVDTGDAYGDRGNGFSYGWNGSIAANTRDRNVITGQVFDTLVLTQENGHYQWEIAVPNGRYTVRAAAGDPSFTDSFYHFDIEGWPLLQQAPSSLRRWVIGTRVVDVYDGALTLTNGASASNNKLAWIEINQHLSVRVNFQPADAPVPAGYLADTGAVYGDRGNGFSYGWSADNRANTRDRNAAGSPDQRYDTLVRTQNGGSFSWAIGLPDGGYDVQLAAGDAGFTDSVYKIDLNGTPLIRHTPTSAEPWAGRRASVQVSDGKLQITNAAGASNNKLNFIDITAQAPPASEPPPLFYDDFERPDGYDSSATWDRSWDIRSGAAHNYWRGYASLRTTQPHSHTSYVLETSVYGFAPLAGPSPADSTDLVFGGTDPEDWNFYRVIYYPTAFSGYDRLLLQRISSAPGQEISIVTLDSADVYLPTDRWIRWKVVRNGASGLIQVFIDMGDGYYQPIPMLEAHDSTFATLGHFGWILESQSIGDFYVDWIKVSPL